jgi:TolA-binding protein
MKSFLIFVCVVIGGYLVVQDWVTSGKMDAFIQQHQSPNSTPKILYALSQINYLAQNHKTASFYYRWLVKDYPKSDKVPQSLWELGQCYEELHDRNQAIEQYTILMSSYPNTEYGRLANGRYGQIKY